MDSLRSRALSALAAGMLVGFSAPAIMAQADAPMPNPPEFPFENPLLPDQDILGKFLFWEEQVSHDNTMACGTCHIHEAGGSDPRSTTTINPGPDGIFGNDDDINGSAGVVRIDNDNNFVHGGVFGSDVQVTGRKSPTAINAVYFNDLFWDGRALNAYTDPQTGMVEIAYLGALESQAAGPPVSDVEMSSVARNWDDIALKLTNAVPMKLATDLPAEMADFLADNPTYPAMFKAVYGSGPITSKKIVFAIANYERTLISDETVLDDFLKGTISEFPPALAPGFDLFQGAGNCASCHTLPFTMDNDYHNIGVRPDAEDLGRFNTTGTPGDEARFKTPNIRNSKLRLPLFHNGSADTIADLIEFYDGGGDFPGPNLDPDMIVLNLTAQEKADLALLIEDGMTDARVENAIFPFTRPTLRSELPSLNSEYGVESDDGLGNFPTLLGHQPAFVGNQNYTLGVADATPNAPAVLLMCFQPDLTGGPFSPGFPVPLNVDLSTLFLDITTATDADGIASFNLKIHFNNVLAGMKFYNQWFIFDANAVATGGVYGTKGLEVEIL